MAERTRSSSGSTKSRRTGGSRTRSPRPAAKRQPTAKAERSNDAQAVIEATQELALESMRATAPFGVGRPLSAAPDPADIVDETEKAGPAFGAFVKSVGMGVAEAQTALDKNLVETAKALSDTNIDVIAVFEQQIDDDGNMTKGVAQKEKLPLINYLMPTAYQWTRVFLQADMQVAEFNAANGFNVMGKSSYANASASANYGLFSGFGARGGFSAGTSSYEASGGTTLGTDLAAGQMHMEATLEPRGDVQLPRPFVLQKGPSLKLTAGAREDILGPAPDGGGTAPVIGRKVTLTAKLTKATGEDLSGKALELKIDQPLLNYSTTPTTGKTDTSGELKIEIKRVGAAFDSSSMTAIVRVWLGLISQTVAINL